MKEKSEKEEAAAFVDEVMKGRNVQAHERLERILKRKAARRVKDTLEG